MDAFEELVLRNQQTALNVAYRFLGVRDRAEDVVQEAFLKILAAAPRYRPTARFRTYLYGVVWRLCVDFYRRRKPGALDPRFELADSSDGPVGEALRGEAGRRVRRAIDALPQRQRMAVVLKHYEGLSYREIAHVLACSARAVDALLARARNRLRDDLQDLWEQ